MARNLTNMNNTNVYVNTNLSANAPVVVNQTSFNNPITVSLKGLNGYGSAGQVMKMNSLATQLEWADDNSSNWTLSSNNLYPNSTSDRVIIGDTSSFNSSTGLTLKGTSNGFYTNGILDINREAGNRIYLACDKDNSNDIYFGDANSGVGGTDGVLLRQETDNSDNNVFKINSVSAGANTDRVNIDMPANNDTKLKVQSSTNAYLELKENDNNYVDLRYEVGASNDSFKNVFYHTDGNQSIFNYNHNPTLSNRELIFYPKTEFDSDVLLNHTGGVSTQSKLIFSNDTNSNTCSFECSENTNNFSFKKNTTTVFDYDDTNSPAQFTMYALFKFNELSFQNSSNQQIDLPTSAGKLALLSDIEADVSWDLSSPNLYPKSNLYNVLIGTQTPDASAPKLEVNGDTLLGGDVATTGNLTVRSRYKIEFDSPNTYLYDPTSYSISNPYSQFNINGTLHLLNLPVDNGASSLFKFTKTGSTEIMTIDATGLMTLNGDDVAEINISNTGNTNDVSTLKFSNATNSNLYKFQFMDSANAFTFFRDAIPVFQHNSSTDVFEVNSQLTVANGVTSALELSSNTNTGAQSILNFTTNGTSKYTYVYDNDTGEFSLKNASAANLFLITSANVYTSSIDHNISGKLTLSGSTPQISDGTNNYTLPTDKGGTFAMRSDLANQVLNVSGTTMTCDTAADQTDICTEFKVSANGSDGDVSLIVEADRDNTNQDSNPKILLKQDGGNSVGTIEFTTTGNVLKISNSVSGADLDLATNGGVVKIDSDGSTSGDFDLTSDSKNINFQNYGSGGQQSFMNKLRFNDNDDCYISGQYETNSNAVGSDIVIKMSGGDMRLFRGNTPNSNASNYDSLLFINPSQTLYLYGGPSATNIFLSSTAFDGNRTYSGGTSDDRLKHNEALITNATSTLMKLRPQIYMKDSALPQSRDRKNPDVIVDNVDIIQELEAGLIAQEVYYEVPELRHLVITRVENASDIQELPDDVDLNDIQNDPDYVALGWNQYEPANVKYMELIPYLIKMNQEQQEEIDTLKQELLNIKNILQNNNIE